MLKRQELRTDLISVPPTIYSLPIESLNYQFYQLLLNQLENDLADHRHWFWKQDVLCTILCLKILLDSMIKKKKRRDSIDNISSQGFYQEIIYCWGTDMRFKTGFSP